MDPTKHCVVANPAAQSRRVPRRAVCSGITNVYDQIHRAVLDGGFDTARELSRAFTADHLSDARLGRTFSFAATKGYVDLLRWWIERGARQHLKRSDRLPADPSSSADWWSPLHFAVAARQHDVVQLFLDNGAQPDEGVRYWTPLLDAIGDDALCTLLRDAGARDTFFTAVASGDIPTISAHMEPDPELVGLRDEFNRTPLMCVTTLGAAEFLIAAGADVNAADNRRNRPLHHILGGHYTRERTIGADIATHAIVSLLLDAGADVNVGNVRRVRPLHNACRIAHFAAARDLIDAGAYINARDSNRETPLFRVVNKPQETRLVQLLLDRGARADITARRGKTPLSIARGENTDLVQSQL